MDDEIRAAFDEMQKQIREKKQEQKKAMEKARTKSNVAETSQDYHKMRMRKSVEDTAKGIEMIRRFNNRLGR